MVKHYSQKQSNTFKAKHKSPSRIVYGNRGMTLEQEINDSNQYYLEREIAVIHKKPIPIQIVDVDYPKRSAAVIKKSVFQNGRQQLTITEFIGGYYLDFEAKETKK